MSDWTTNIATLESMMVGDDPVHPLLRLAARPEWHVRAACRGFGHSWFIPSSGQQSVRAAMYLCGQCPVRDDCLAVALAESGLEGIWGGTTDEQRKRMRDTTI